VLEIHPPVVEYFAVGKKTKTRDCPAAGRQITSSECAIGRHTAYACPETCSFNVFSVHNYPDFRSIEDSANQKFFNWLLENVPDRAAFESGLQRRLDGEASTPYFHYLAWHGVYQVGPDGDSILGKWEKAGFPGLSVDEQIFMQGKGRMRPAIIEAHRIMDHCRVEVVDLLDPTRAPFLIVDSLFAGQAVRFGVYFADVVPLPHYSRLFGACLMVPNLHPVDPEELCRELITHLGGPSDTTGIRRWLGEHAEKFEDAMTAVSLARRKLMFEAFDAQVGRAVYEIQHPYGDCCQRLGAKSGIDGDPVTDVERGEGFTEAKVWFAAPDDSEVGSIGQGAVLGRVLLGPTHWRVEALGAERLARLRGRFEALMQDAVKFVGERRDDVGARLRMQEPQYDAALVPPSLLREPPRLVTTLSRVPAKGATPEETAAAVIEENLRRILDEPIPALENQTPRQAAANPALRAKLVAWTKYWVFQTDQENLHSGRNTDVNWMLRELGLTKLLFDPPPARPPLDSPEDSFDDDPDAVVPWELLPDPPPLPDRPWDMREAGELMARALQSFKPTERPSDYFSDLEYPLFPILQEFLEESADRMLTVWILQVSQWLVLCYAPRGTRPPEVDTDQLIDSIERYLQKVADWNMAGGFEELPAWITQHRQPELLKLAIVTAIEFSSKGPRKYRLAEKHNPLLMALMAGVLESLDEGARALL
jgi:hypothetical protein